MGSLENGVRRVIAWIALTLGIFSLSAAKSALAQSRDQPAVSSGDGAPPHHSVAFDVPRVAYTDTAFGSAPLVLGAAGFGEARGAESEGSSARLGGGIRVWGSPIDRVLLVVDAQRRD